MNRRDLLKAAFVAAGAATGAAQTVSEKKGTTEPLDLQRKTDNTLAGRRPYEPMAHPYKTRWPSCVTSCSDN